MSLEYFFAEQNLFTLKQKYMKTIFTLLLSTLFSLASFAYDGVRLTISSVISNKMFVEVDGRRYNLDGKTVMIRDIRPGYHNVKVYREAKRNNGWKIGNRNKREQTLYNTRVYLKDGYHFDIVVNRFGKVLVDEIKIAGNDEWYTDDDDYYEKDRDRDREYDRDNRDQRDYDDRYDRNNRDLRYDEMSESAFNQAKESLKREWFENTRLSTAKQIIDRNYFTSRQVKELVLLFTFENNRLDIAKYAYSKTVDKGNYFIMNDAFSMNKNKEELNNFIREQR
jgi:hypothetical protein